MWKSKAWGKDLEVPSHSQISHSMPLFLNINKNPDKQKIFTYFSGNNGRVESYDTQLIAQNCLAWGKTHMSALESDSNSLQSKYTVKIKKGVKLSKEANKNIILKTKEYWKTDNRFEKENPALEIETRKVVDYTSQNIERVKLCLSCFWNTYWMDLVLISNSEPRALLEGLRNHIGYLGPYGLLEI